MCVTKDGWMGGYLMLTRIRALTVVESYLQVHAAQCSARTPNCNALCLVFQVL